MLTAGVTGVGPQDNGEGDAGTALLAFTAKGGVHEADLAGGVGAGIFAASDGGGSFATTGAGGCCLATGDGAACAPNRIRHACHTVQKHDLQSQRHHHVTRD